MLNVHSAGLVVMFSLTPCPSALASPKDGDSAEEWAGKSVKSDSQLLAEHTAPLSSMPAFGYAVVEASIWHTYGLI